MTLSMILALTFKSRAVAGAIANSNEAPQAGLKYALQTGIY